MKVNTNGVRILNRSLSMYWESSWMMQLFKRRLKKGPREIMISSWLFSFRMKRCKWMIYKVKVHDYLPACGRQIPKITHIAQVVCFSHFSDMLSLKMWHFQNLDSIYLSSLFFQHLMDTLSLENWIPPTRVVAQDHIMSLTEVVVLYTFHEWEKILSDSAGVKL